MLEYLAIIFSGVLSVAMGFLGVQIAVKKYIKRERILEITEFLTDEVLNNVEYQKKLYLVGGLIGQGIKGGIGLPKTTGKFKMEDAIGQLIAMFAQNMMAKAMKQPMQPQLEEGLRSSFGR